MKITFGFPAPPPLAPQLSAPQKKHIQKLES